MTGWHIYLGTGIPHDGITNLPAPPPWRNFGEVPATPFEPDENRHAAARRSTRTVPYIADEQAVRLVNTALLLRRPLLVTGDPGIGKSSLAYAVAHELKLGQVLRWPITSRTALNDGLYRYDAISRIEGANLRRAGVEEGIDLDIGRFVRLGPLGTALAPYALPRVLLVDEVDKSDIDLPNDLLDAFEEGEFEIPELSRIADVSPEVLVRPSGDGTKILVREGFVRCRSFPFVVMTSNGERDFPPAFLRRCIRLELAPPSQRRLAEIAAAHLGPELTTYGAKLIEEFLERRHRGPLATDQLLNAIYLSNQASLRDDMSSDELADLVLQHLTMAADS